MFFSHRFKMEMGNSKAILTVVASQDIFHFWTTYFEDLFGGYFSIFNSLPDLLSFKPEK